MSSQGGIAYPFINLGQLEFFVGYLSGKHTKCEVTIFRIGKVRGKTGGFCFVRILQHAAACRKIATHAPFAIFTRESSYCFQRVLAIAILSVHLFVRPSHGWITQKR